ncbi:gp53-like domain-containing protein [Enterobacter roggenkampii]|uniref:gp53-like domain-containing protein n=1 Tax=Enterobacter roggenkampii TaxID=1812935 RepID=UPI003F4286C4
MALQLLAANNAQSVLAAGISASATALTLNTGTGALFPSPVSGTSFFKLTLIDAATGQISEIVHVTAKSGDVLTIVRGQEGTAARSWSANDIAANMLTAGTILLLAQLESPAFTGTPTAPTAPAGTNTTQIANTAFIQDAITALSLGTASQRNVGTGTGQIPDISAFTSSTGATGYQRFPGGLVFQWGFTNPSPNNTTNTVSFPIAYATRCNGVSLQYVNSGIVNNPAQGNPFQIGVYTRLGFDFYYTGTATGMQHFWLSWGY